MGVFLWAFILLTFLFLYGLIRRLQLVNSAKAPRKGEMQVSQILMFEKTRYNNVHYIVTVPSREVIGIAYNRGQTYERRLMQGDKVIVKADRRGKICPGIDKPSDNAVIDKVRRDEKGDAYFHVLTRTGQKGYCQASNLIKK